MRPELASLSKILKERLFVRIGEFHSGSKRATRGRGGMRESGAGAEDWLTARSLTACSWAASSPATMAAGALFEV
jgi:hypothetical protein